ncbi:MAG: alginate lyase family protein [Bacteroidales bacterium]|nr:alginate lyase family protein [Bacteroidales bacterium]
MIQRHAPTLLAGIVLALLVLPVHSLDARVAGGQKTRINDGWQFVRGDLGSIWEAVRPVKAGNPEDVPLWTEVTLPHCFNAEDGVDPDVNYYEGPGWYRTCLQIGNPFPGGRTLLEFEGAGQKTEVYVYTTRVGSHIGGYDSWNVDITDAVEAFLKSPDAGRFKGKVPVSIRCDNSRDVEMIPSDLADFNIYGGLYRYLNLVYVPAVSVERLRITPSLDGKRKSGAVRIEALLNDPLRKGTADAQVTVRDAEGKVIVRQALPGLATDGPSVLAEFTVKKPHLWDVDDTYLYSCEVKVSADGQTDTATERFGFRSFEFAEKGPFYLNGRRLLLQGTHRHEDHAGVGAAMTEEQIATEMRLMKEMGVNFIRLGHYQQSEIVLRQCDSLGILVWEEIPWCRGGLGGERYRQQARQMLTHMVQQHFNHPAVIIWGLGNENDWPNDFPEFDKQQIRAFMAELNTLSHELDPERKTAIRRCAFCSDIVDVYSPSIWAGWYRGAYVDYKEESEREMQKVKHFLHVEWGGDSHAGRHSEDIFRNIRDVVRDGADERAGDASLYGGAKRVSRDGDWSETYIVHLIDWHLKEQETMPWLTGTAYWPFKDFSTPVRPDNPVPYVNQKGVLQRDFTPKESYYVFQSYWTDKPMVHIYGHTWPVRWGDPGEKKEILVYSNCSEVELFVNGVSQGRKTRNSQDYPAAGFHWDVALQAGPVTVQAVATRKGGVRLTDEIAFRYVTEPWGPAARMAARAVAAEDGRVRIDAEVLDAQGRRCLDDKRFIRFQLAGDGTLIRNQGTPTGSSKVQACNGLASIYLDPGAGRAAVAVLSEGLQTQIVSLDPVRTSLEEAVLTQAEQDLKALPVTVTAYPAVRSEGTIHDFFSEGDYWWPDPKNPDGPYIRRDGETNPDNFVAHRHAMIRFSQIVGNLASAFLLTGEQRYADAVQAHVRAWFIDPDTRMNPNLLYAQAIHGVTPGRGIGIIDTIHLIEVAQSLIRLQEAGALPAEILDGARQWFADYLQWLKTHPNSTQEMNATNNHGTCWAFQAAAFAKFVGDRTLMDFCADRFKSVFLVRQMADDGSFPRELQRTKPYGYSIFNLDAMAGLCQILSTPEDNLWDYTTPEGHNMRKALDFLLPYIQDKSTWPYGEDVMYWEEWPVAQPAFLFGWAHFGDAAYYRAWQGLDHFPTNEEVIRNLPLRNPILWIDQN